MLQKRPFGHCCAPTQASYRAQGCPSPRLNPEISGWESAPWPPELTDASETTQSASASQVLGLSPHMSTGC